VLKSLYTAHPSIVYKFDIPGLPSGQKFNTLEIGFSNMLPTDVARLVKPDATQHCVEIDSETNVITGSADYPVEFGTELDRLYFETFPTILVDKPSVSTVESTTITKFMSTSGSGNATISYKTTAFSNLNCSKDINSCLQLAKQTG
jgi:hypothetical protein